MALHVCSWCLEVAVVVLKRTNGFTCLQLDSCRCCCGTRTDEWLHMFAVGLEDAVVVLQLTNDLKYFDKCSLFDMMSNGAGCSKSRTRKAWLPTIDRGQICGFARGSLAQMPSEHFKQNFPS